ncbi:hypothetical protein L2E82_36601 [Cichorium intybus]|uniref:Uncharacterized protein n=1 Tax=Cichorium intybus TaxID=13427 RepID=A0ACB9ADK1_CICIN|nr:hypothetical protein L2E82_36601 [Cichorium intybus]
MDRNPRRDKFAKAKIEEPNLNLRLPRELFPKRDGDPLDDNTRKAHQAAETVDSGDKLDRKLNRIRNKELITVFGDDYEGMREIHRVSKATIGILADTESNLLRHSFLDLVGTVEEVRTAEELILDEVLKTYSSLTFPVILMPPIIYGDHITIPLNKVNCVLGTYSTNLLRMEMESGAWIKHEDDKCVDGHGDEDEKEGDEWKEKRKEDVEDKCKNGEESEDVGPTSASGCYGSDLQCLSHV